MYGLESTTFGTKLGTAVCFRSFDDITPRGYQVVVAGGTVAVDFLRNAKEGSAMRKVRQGQYYCKLSL